MSELPIYSFLADDENSIFSAPKGSSCLGILNKEK